MVPVTERDPVALCSQVHVSKNVDKLKRSPLLIGDLLSDHEP